MANKANGIVEKIYENQTKTGMTTYAFVVDGVRYGTYNIKPPCNQGDMIEFTFTAKGDFNNADAKSIRKSEKQPAPAQAAPVAAYANAGGSSRSDAVQDAITFQAARKDAIQFLELLSSLDVLDLGSKSKGQKIKNAEAYLDGYTKRFYEDTKTLGHEEVEEEPEEEEAPVAAVRRTAKPKPAHVEEDEFEDQIPF